MRLTYQLCMGCHQAKQPRPGKVGIRPPLVVFFGPPSTVLLAPPPQNTSQSHAHPLVHRRTRRPVAVSEIPKPASQRRAHRPHDGRHTASVGALGLRAQGVFELPQALRARPSIASFKVVAQEVEAARLRGIDDARFLRVQAQNVRFDPDAYLLQDRLGLGSSATLDDEVVGGACHLVARLGHLVIQQVEIDVGEQRTPS